MEFEQLETARLILKKLTPEILVSLFENYLEEDIMRQLGLADEAELVKEKEKLQGGYVTYDRTIVSFLLVLKDSNITIGRCGYHNWYAAHRKAELGYALNHDGY